MGRDKAVAAKKTEGLQEIIQGINDLKQHRLSGCSENEIEDLMIISPGFNLVSFPHNKRCVLGIFHVKQHYVETLRAQIHNTITRNRLFFLSVNANTFCLMLHPSFKFVGGLTALTITIFTGASNYQQIVHLIQSLPH